MSQDAMQAFRMAAAIARDVKSILGHPEGSQAPSCARPGCSEHVTYRCGHQSVKRYCSAACHDLDAHGHLTLPPGEFQAYSTPADKAKMASNRAAVLSLMLDGKSRSLRMIRAECGFDPETEVSARLRELRRPEYGGYEVKCWREPNRVYLYQLGAPE